MTSKISAVQDRSPFRMIPRKPDLPEPEVTKENRMGLIFAKFRNSGDERLYRIYFKRQKLVMIFSYFMFAFLTNLCMTTTEALKNPSAKIAKLSVFATILVLNILILLFCNIPKVSVKLKTCGPILIWILLITEIFFDLGWGSSIPSDGLMWIMVLIYLTYISLPARLYVCILLSLLVSVGHVITVSVQWTQRAKNVTLLGNQVGANVLLMACSHVLGVIYYIFSDRQQRRSFEDTKASLSVKVAIQEEYKHQEQLLLSVLPKHVADEMVRDWGEDADGQFRKIFLTRYENVSILFADIVGFTAISSSCTAAELVKILNELFANFDKLAHKYHQHRIKILGDCYYCVCGAPDPRPDHAVLCIHMGLSVVEAITYVREKTKKDVNMRVGIHTGAVLGGVLGQRQWQYDVLGKEVTLANKMESGGIPGRVHISETTKSFLHDDFELEPGNGDQREDYLRIVGMNTYLVKAVLKQLKSSQLNNAPFSKNDLENGIKNGMLPNGKDVNGNSSTKHKRSLQEANSRNQDISRLEDVLLENKNQGNTVEYFHPLTSSFVDAKLEERYQSRREKFSAVTALGLCFVATFTFLARLCVLPITLFGGISFGIGIVILVVMATVTLAANIKTASCLKRFAQWIEVHFVCRILWTGTLVLIVTATDIVDVFGCIKVTSVNSTENAILYPSDPTCAYPPYFVHTGSLVLLGIANIMQIGHIAKSLLVVVMTTVFCVLDILVKMHLFDQYDSHVYTQQERDYLLFPSKYHLTSALIAVSLGVIIFARQTDVISRRLFLWTEEADKQKEQVAKIRIKNEALVYNLLPGHVAKDFMGIQKDVDELYSHAYNDAGVVFAACPNFHDFYNESSVNKNGLECFRFLNEIISDYDELLEQNRFSSISKIKTVGPTYMAASGMAGTVITNKKTSLKERWKHLDDLVQFAFALKETLKKINEQSFNNFILRIGINHGPVIAGVIGARKPHYDIWGNTVNVASRMESTGHSGQIQVVEETMKILKVFGYKFKKRGLIKVKGKGELMTFFVENRVTSSPSVNIPNQAF